MSYNKRVWANGDLITKEKINHMEDGIYDAHDKINAIDNEVSSQIKETAKILYNRVPISRFNINENDDITDIINSLEDNKILVLDGYYKITDTVVLKNKHLTGGCIYYEGSIDKQPFIIRQNGGLYDTKIKINVKNFASDLILIDYTDSDIQLDRNDYILRNLKIDNTIQDVYINNSCCIKINVNKYQVIAYQNIDNIHFTGVMDYGIYIECILRNNNDNPVYNTTMFSNISFETVNCALKVYPKMLSGEVENSRGGVGLYLNKFSNQHRSWVNKPFIDIVNTTIEGNLVIPWDYYGDSIPEEGIYKTLNSSILLNRNYFEDTRVINKDVYYNYCLRSTGEIYNNINITRAKNIENDVPLRNSSIGWAIDNIKQVVFIPQSDYNPYNHRYVGFEFQQNNGDNPQNDTYQLGINRNGKIILRHYDSTTNQWEKPVNIMIEGKISQSYSGNRPDGIGIGDMKFDTTINKPVFWKGTEWVLADGTSAF